MTNGEKYKKEILDFKETTESGEVFCEKFVKPKILKNINIKCPDISCAKCKMIQSIWLQEEYKKSEVDWSNVAVDTRVLVSCDNEHWKKRYFSHYKDGYVYTFSYGKDSWTNDNSRTETGWIYAKLAEDKE